MTTTSEFNISTVINVLWRRQGLVIASFVVVSVLAAYLATVLPNIYRSSTSILVTPQRLPSSFVTSTVTGDLDKRLQSIVEEILSTSQLERINREFDLYPVGSKGSRFTDPAERLRKAIKIDLRRNNPRDPTTVIQLSFDSTDREKAIQVVRRLGSLFVSESLQAREQEAVGTKRFMTAEADRLRNDLEQQEAVVNRYKAAHPFELPDQLDTNLRTLEQVRRELESNNQRLSALEERKAVLQKQAVESDNGDDRPSLEVQLELKKKQLDALLQKYSEKHPDVIQMRNAIQTLEAEIRSGAAARPSLLKPVTASPLKQVLQKQLADIDGEIQAIRLQGQSLRTQIGTLQTRINETPSRAIELSKLSRGYEITLKKYQDLLSKTLESELSENMEKKQKGEQFQILDPANLPLKPFWPNRHMIVFLGLLGGLAGGVGLAFAWDNLDTSFKGGDELEEYIDIPLLATLPTLRTRGTVLDRRRAHGALMFASIAILTVGVVCIHFIGLMYF